MLSAKKELFTPSGGGYQISRSVRLRSSASAYLNRTITTASNRKTFTWSGWVKKAVVGSSTGAVLFCSTDNSTSTGWLHFNTGSVGSADTLTFEDQLTSTVLVTTQIFRDPSAWYHIIVAIDTTQATASNRAKLYVNGTQVTAFSTATYPTQNADTNFNRSSFRHTIGTQIAGSRYFDGYLTEINFVDGQALTPSSFGETNIITGVWQPKRYTGTYGTNGFYLPFSDNSGADSFGIGADKSANALNRVELGDTNVGYTILGTMTFASGGAAQVHLRDNNSTTAAADSGGLNTNTALGYDFGRAIKVRRITTLTAAANGTSVSSIFNIQYSDDNSTWTTVTGSATTHTFSAGLSQSNTTDIDDNGSHRYWRLKYLSGTTAGNFWIATLDMYVNDIGPNSWFPVNVSTTAGTTYDSMLDVPTPYDDGTAYGRGNYATLNPLFRNSSMISESNLHFNKASIGWATTQATIPLPPSKTYFEATAILVGGANSGVYIGIATASATQDTYQIANQWSFGGSGGVLNLYNQTTLISPSGSSAAGDILQVAYDGSTGNLWFGKNNTWYNSTGGTTGNPSTGANPTITLTAGTEVFPCGICYANAMKFTFGQRPFSYTPPTGFKALNTQNLPDAPIKNGASYMAATLYTGNGSSQSISNTVSGVSMQPDLVWVKKRSATENHELTDSVRGNNLRLASNTTDAQSAGGIAMASTGFALSGGYGTDNENAQTYVGWQWNAGGSTVTNTSGSISAQVRANPTAGFSIVGYTGTGANATVGHGLGVAPKMIIVKRRNGAIANWRVYHANLTSPVFNLFLSLSNAQTSDATIWNSTAPTSSVFSIGTSIDVNTTSDYIAYCFAEVAGYSKFGNYVGTSTSDGTFVYLGFRPRWIMIKNISIGTAGQSDWFIVDTSRNTYNVVPNYLLANLANAEATSGGNEHIDILSNGFKLRGGSNYTNSSSYTYIYAAFAENPFKNSLAR